MGSDKPLVSVILPVYNVEKYLPLAIESILDQTYKKLEILISDDGSKDNSRFIINRYSKNDHRIVVSHNKSNLGKIATVNRLFHLSKGKYITVHDGDDFSLSQRVEKQIERMEREPSLKMCGTSFETLQEDGTSFGTTIMEQKSEVIKENIWKHSQFHGPTMMFKKEVIDRLGGQIYRPFFQDYNEDVDLSLRVLSIGKCVNLPEVLYKYRIRPDSLSKTITPKKKVMFPLALNFYCQRLENGVDDLDKGEIEKIHGFQSKLLLKYEKDKSMIFRENAAFLMYYNLYRNAVKEAWIGCKTEPARVENWRTLQYCLRKRFFGF